MQPIDAARPGLAGFNTSQGSHDKTATVRKGETTLAQVAERLNVDPHALIRANPQIGNPRALKAGQEIHLPHQQESPAAHPLPAPTASPAGPRPAGSADPLLTSLAQFKLDQDAATTPGTVSAIPTDSVRNQAKKAAATAHPALASGGSAKAPQATRLLLSFAKDPVGTGPIQGDVTQHGYGRAIQTHYNPMYFASDETARQLAQLLG
jgi:hypothetical protein